MDSEEKVESESERIAIAITKEALLRFFREERPRSLFYLGQLEVLFEDRPLITARNPEHGKKGPFHWITSKAVSQLAAEGRIAAEVTTRTPEGAPHGLRFFHAKSYRNFHMEARRIEQLVSEYSRAEFTRALGHQLELLVDSAMSGARFHVAGRDINEWQGRKWEKTNENLDRVYVSKEGIEYGCEMKNTLPYIERGEFERKLEMCRVLGLRPLFVARMMPETYIFEAWKAGGNSLVLKKQYYPLAFEALATRVRNMLGLPVACARSLPEGDIARFVSWHENSIRV